LYKNLVSFSSELSFYLQNGKFPTFKNRQTEYTMKNNDTWNSFADRMLSSEEAREVKGGYKKLPGHSGGYGSTGMVHWGEIEVRNSISATGGVQLSPSPGPRRGGH
jgi:hypothetical protein